LRAAYDHLPLIATRNTIGNSPGADGHHNKLSFDPPDARSVDIVRQAWRLGIPIGAQNSGVFTLGQAGVLKGKRFAVQAENASSFPGATFAGVGVVVDGNVVTSGTCPYRAQERNKPDGTAELTQKFLALIH
jgi:hypothetical protein